MFAGMSDTKASTPSPAKLLREQERSGLTIAAFARERGIAPWKLYTARRQRRLRRDSPRGGFTAVKLVDDGPSGEGFELDLPGGRRLHIPRGFDEGELVRLMTALRAC